MGYSASDIIRTANSTIRKTDMTTANNKYESSLWDMLDYISQDFVFNLFYMMIHKRFIRYFVIDYHRIYDLIRAIQRINPPLPPRILEEKINILFAGIETEEEVLDMFKLLRYNAIIRDDKIIITNDTELDDNYNPVYPDRKSVV